MTSRKQSYLPITTSHRKKKSVRGFAAYQKAETLLTIQYAEFMQNQFSVQL